MPRSSHPSCSFWIVTALVIGLSSLPAHAETSFDAPEPTPQESYSIRPASSEITIDGRLDEPAWRDAVAIPVRHEWFPGDNTPAPVRTDVLLAYDSEKLYLAFRAFDPDPSAIRAYLADRDSAFSDDTVGFLLDTFNDGRRAFQFRVNALGVQMEALSSDLDNTEDWSWDMIWNSAGRITDQGYVVEVALPFKQLRFPSAAPGEAIAWGFLAMRDYPRSVRHRLRSVANDRAKNCFVCQAQTLQGLEGIRPGRDLQISPTLTSTRTDLIDSFPDGDLVKGDEKVDPGLTVRWGITPNISLSAALNPDFSQVEADAAQLDVNERFALFFPEKRPFFLEGADFFNSPINAVFTRTVADPAWGTKITGKEGRNGFGVFVAQDRVNNLIFPGNQGSGRMSIDEDVLSSVLRFRRDIGKTSSLGVLYAGRRGDGLTGDVLDPNDPLIDLPGAYSNEVFGIDGILRPTASDSVRFQILGSRTEYPDAVAILQGQPLGSFDDVAFEIDYTHGERNWWWFFNHRDLGEDFRADSGFLPRVDLRSTRAGARRTFWGDEDSWYRRFEIFWSADTARDQAGEIEEWGADLSFVYQGPMQSVIEIFMAPNDEYFEGENYDNFRYGVYGSFQPHGGLELEMLYLAGKQIDFVNGQQADFYSIEPEITFNLGRHVEGELEYTHQVFEVEGEKLFTADLGEMRLLYHFNRRTFVRGIFQYRAVDRNLDLFRVELEAEVRDFFTQILFSYKINPQTVILAGYSDSRFGLDDISLTQTGRSIFLKLGYAFLL